MSENTTCKQLTLFAEDSLASLTVQPEKDKPHETNGICGENFIGSLAKLSLDGSWLKMYQGYCQVKIDGTLEKFSMVWPKSGTMQNGVIYQLRALDYRISENDFSLWPTPTASMSIDMKFSTEQALKRLRRNQSKGFQIGSAGGSLTDKVIDELGGYPTPEFVELMMGFPVGWTDIKD